MISKYPHTRNTAIVYRQITIVYQYTRIIESQGEIGFAFYNMSAN